MNNTGTINYRWMKFMYLYTIVGAGGFGIGILAMPETVKMLFRWPADEPISLGIVGSVYAAFGIMSFFGLREPLKFAPLLVLQLCYKSLWFLAVALQLLMTGRFPGYAIPLALIFATYVIGDLIAIPFSYLFGKDKAGVQTAV